MAKIRADDIAVVREQVQIDDVVRDTVELRPAGGGSLKGLCPFHDERSPSFQVSPAKGLWYCFGCGEGGDTIDFVRRVDGVSFAEAVEKLAVRCGVELHYEEGDSSVRREQGRRTRLVAATAAAADFFREQFDRPDAAAGREFLAQRELDGELAARFGVGFAPRGWDGLTAHLRSRGFTDDELLAAGLAVAGNRGPYDRFRGRLVWPIRDSAGDVVGFGARHLLEEDKGPKYLNTPDTPLYHKSQVLFGIDLARRAIAKDRRVVIVEGYTDVMACHAAGVTTAVATCGTAFGEGHVRVLRRLMFDADALHGQIIFTFDADAAGRRAALRALDSDQEFVAQTFVAVGPDGLDPCEVRLERGDAAVQDLVDSRIPLVEFAMRARLAEFDLDTSEGRVAALRSTGGLVNSIRDVALRDEYAGRLAGWLGVDRAAVLAAGRNGARGGSPAGRGTQGGDRAPSRRQQVQPPAGQSRPDVGELPPPRLEAQALHAIVQRPDAVWEWVVATEDTAFTDSRCLAVFRALAEAGDPRSSAGEAADERRWLDRALAAAADDGVRALIRRWAVLPLPVLAGKDTAPYAEGIVARLHAADLDRRIAPLKARLARAEGLGTDTDLAELMAEVMRLEGYRRELLAMAVGDL